MNEQIKFSVIVPIYNTEKYLEKCLMSIKNGKYQNFEVIMVLDGSKDHSIDICKKFSKDTRFRYYEKENGGLSDARNYGAKKAVGDYLLFIDSDDFIAPDLLFYLKKELDESGHLDIIRFQVETIKEDQKEQKQTAIFHKETGELAFQKLIKSNYFVPACFYAYNRKYFQKNKFQYAKGRVHEDFGLTPIVIIKANSVSSIDKIGYYYVLRENSIMTSNSIEKLKKKNEDCFYHFDYLLNEIEKTQVSDYSKKLFQSYVSNAMIDRCKLLDGKLLKEYILELKKRKIGKYLMSDTFLRKVKKVFFCWNPKLYIKWMVK